MPLFVLALDFCFAFGLDLGLLAAPGLWTWFWVRHCDSLGRAISKGGGVGRRKEWAAGVHHLFLKSLQHPFFKGFCGCRCSKFRNSQVVVSSTRTPASTRRASCPLRSSRSIHGESLHKKLLVRCGNKMALLHCFRGSPAFLHRLSCLPGSVSPCSCFSPYFCMKQ